MVSFFLKINVEVVLPNTTSDCQKKTPKKVIAYTTLYKTKKSIQKKLWHFEVVLPNTTSSS